MRGALVLAAMVSAGCVGKGKFDAVLAEREQCDARAAQLEEAQRGLETDVARLTGEVRALEQRLETARSALASKSAEAGELAQNVEKMRAALSEAEARQAQAAASLSAYRDLIGRLRSMIDAGTLRVKVVGGRMIVEMATDILFDVGQATLSAPGERAVAELGSVLAGLPDREFQVAGHTDDVPIASKKYQTNWHLGAARAIAVVDILTRVGVPNTRVSVASYAETRPVAPNRTEEGRRANRRIEVVIVPDLSLLPGYSDLEALARQP
jgi:chemotaxis protein MotB